MSKILDLAKNFQQTSQTEVEISTEAVRNVIKQQEIDLTEQLKNASKNLAENIQIEQSKLIKKTVKMFHLPVLIGSGLIVAMIIVLMVLGWLANSEYNEMTEWRASAKIYKEQSGKMKLSNCTISETNMTKACAKIDKNYLNKSWEGNYKILDMED